MTRYLDARHLNIQALADSEKPLAGSTPLHKMERLAPESVEPGADTVITWQLRAESRTGAGGQLELWMHIKADAAVALTCQRCMTPVAMPLAADQWFRFVASEEVAMAEDDAAQEDLLVMAPQFDALQVIEDELLMALPLVPMHEVCPSLPAFRAGQIDALEEPADEKPNPFAALAKLKKPV